MKKRKMNIRIPSERGYQINPATIVADGAIAAPNNALGKLIPLVIVDTTDRPDITDVVQAHGFQPAGDVITWWAKPVRPGAHSDSLINLALHFIRPVNSFVGIMFQRKHAGLVDQIVRTRLLYLQGGRPGDRLSNTLENDRILVEVGDSDFQKTWGKLLLDTTVDEFRFRGLSRKQSMVAANQAIAKLREIGDIRMKPRDQKTTSNESEARSDSST